MRRNKKWKEFPRSLFQKGKTQVQWNAAKRQKTLEKPHEMPERQGGITPESLIDRKHSKSGERVSWFNIKKAKKAFTNVMREKWEVGKSEDGGGERMKDQRDRSKEKGRGGIRVRSYVKQRVVAGRLEVRLGKVSWELWDVNKGRRT